MSNNKEALIRYRIIDSCLRNKHLHYPSMENIQDKISDVLGKEFSISAIQKDIKTMKEDEALGYKAPISYSRKYNGYFYTDDNFTLTRIPLNNQDITAIDFATTVLEQFKGIPIFEEYSHAVDKIMESIDISRALDGYDETSFIEFEKSPRQQGSTWLTFFVKAIRERNVVKLLYQRFDTKKAKEHIFHPYLLKEYRNRWYVVGMSEKHGYIIIFGLDRIVDASILEDAEFKFSPDFNPEDYFQYSFGITTPTANAEEIILSFTPQQGMYIKSQPIHHSQELMIDNDKECRIKLIVYPSVELRMQILSYGDQVKVISPATLQKEMIDSIKKMIMRYQ